VHRDISPQNVLVSVSGEVKLLDFGVARLAQEETSGVHIKGKLRYMAPEHLGGNSKAPTVDIYGAGAILHELIEGTKYREGADEMQLYNQILGGQTPPLTRGDTPAELAALRNTMLDPDEKTRVQSADRALEMLEGWAGYRSAAGELGRIVRGYMGVNTPRSGIHMQAVVPATVDALADTAPPTAATHTRGTGATSPEISASMPGAGTDPSFSQPIVIQKKGTSALLMGVGAGLLVVAGAVGVALAMRGEKAEPATEVAAATPAPQTETQTETQTQTQTETETKSLDVEPEPEPLGIPDAPPEEDPDVAAAEPSPDVGGGLEEEPVQPEEPEPAKTSRRGRRSGSRGSTASSATTPTDRKPDPPKAKVRVSLRLRAPLTIAYVKIDGGNEVVLEPMKKVDLTLGKHTIMWRPNKDQPFVQGGSVTLTEGGKTTIRITANGARLE